MIRKFLVGIAMLRAEHASDARVTSPGAIRLDLDPMRQAFRYIPSGGKTHRAGRTRVEATARDASGARIEAARVARRVENHIEQQRRAKRDPRAERRMHHDAKDARPGDSRRLAQLDEVERASAAVHGRMHERMNDGVT